MKNVGDEKHAGDEAVAVQNVRGSEDRNGLKDVGNEEHVENEQVRWLGYPEEKKFKAVPKHHYSNAQKSNAVVKKRGRKLSVSSVPRGVSKSMNKHRLPSVSARSSKKG